MTALALILSAFVAAMGLLAIFFPGRADDVARLFADKTGFGLPRQFERFWHWASSLRRANQKRPFCCAFWADSF